MYEPMRCPKVVFACRALLPAYASCGLTFHGETLAAALDLHRSSLSDSLPEWLTYSHCAPRNSRGSRLSFFCVFSPPLANLRLWPSESSAALPFSAPHCSRNSIHMVSNTDPKIARATAYRGIPWSQAFRRDIRMNAARSAPHHLRVSSG